VAYRATHCVLPRCARLTVLHSSFVGFRVAEVQLMREAYVLETLHHSGVPRVFECGLLERRPWVATEHVAGTSIEEAAAERPLPISDALAVVRDAAAILAHAHGRGVVHRNLTPSSIVRTADRAFPVCITEWGDAALHDLALPRPDDPGSRFYRAPELAETDRSDPPSDVFALAAVMFEAATLVLPEPLQRFPGVPAAFHQLLASMLERDPQDRPSAAVVHADATRLCEVYSDSEAAIEEVEVELVDISRVQPAMPALGWMPPEQIASLKGSRPGIARRRKDS
jgi:serine/threonine protein kinase